MLLLPDARTPDQHGVILIAPHENPDDLFGFGASADQRIKACGGFRICQELGVFCEHRTAFPVKGDRLGGELPDAARGAQMTERHAHCAENCRRPALFIAEQFSEECFGADR